MTLPPVSPLLNSLFNVARAKYKAENEFWVRLSTSRGGSNWSWQCRASDLDLLLRCLEDEFNTNKDAFGMDFSFHYQMMFSKRGSLLL